jgi:cytochrome c oxidase cbb3-type subunit IV
MFKEYLQSIEGVEVYAIISMIIFLSFFIVILIWLFRADKKYIKKMKELPLEPDSIHNDMKTEGVSGNYKDLKNSTGGINDN